MNNSVTQTTTPKFIQEYIDQLNTINSSINSSNFGNALNDFGNFIKHVKNIGPYHPNTWREEFTKVAYELGKLIAAKQPDLLKTIEVEMLNCNEVEREILSFIESEIKINLWTFPDSRTHPYLLGLCNKYPLNPEFVHSLGCLEITKGNTLMAITYHIQAHKLNTFNTTFFNDCFNQEVTHIENLIESEKFDEALEYTNTASGRGTYDHELIYKNWFPILVSRIKDHKLIRTTLKKKEDEIASQMEKKLEKERFKAIEMIGIFTAIIAFIFSAISFTTKGFPSKDAFFLEISFGLILMLFIIIISAIFKTKDVVFWKDIRFVAVLVIALALAVIFLFYFNT